MFIYIISDTITMNCTFLSKHIFLNNTKYYPAVHKLEMFFFSELEKIDDDAKKSGITFAKINDKR